MGETATTTATTAAAQQTATETTSGQANTEASQQHEVNNPNIEKLIQSAVDRVRNQMGNENKKLRADLEAERKKHLSETEIKELEIKQEREQFERERAEFKLEKNKLFAIKAIEEAGLKDSKGSASALVDFVMADTEEGITERVKTFEALIKNLVQAGVDEVFKAHGRTPGVGSDSTAATGTKTENSLAVNLGRNAAQVNKNAQDVRNHYMGGK